jgi:hypothetical protein
LAREQALAFARRLLQQCGEKPERIATQAWLLAFGRPAERAETERACAFLLTRGVDRSKPAEAALAELCLALFNANEFAYVD